MKQKNNHARSKAKRKILKLKNFCKRVIEKRFFKAKALKKPKGNTITGNAKAFALAMREDSVIYSAHKMERKNQRQKRKLWRQAPHMRKAA